MSKLPASKSDVDHFLARAKTAKAPALRSTHRIIFALDATASRAPTWDLACSLHDELFNAARDAGNIAVQLVYYRGIDGFNYTEWSTTPASLLARMSTVRCLGGRTQILRVIRHARAQAAAHPVKAVVFVGDCFEEDQDRVAAAAGELAVYGTPMFIFQEGGDRVAGQVFRYLADITRGAHVPFSDGSADELRILLRAVAAYASEGRAGLQRHLSNPLVKRLLTQLDP
ncbi:MAG: VWA domain-containing protein [Gammaproteobacteria bacterium]|nr:VWA domain-containing protein [Gammaproteobacteria bacterium]